MALAACGRGSGSGAPEDGTTETGEAGTGTAQEGGDSAKLQPSTAGAGGSGTDLPLGTSGVVGDRGSWAGASGGTSAEPTTWGVVEGGGPSCTPAGAVQIQASTICLCEGYWSCAQVLTEQEVFGLCLPEIDHCPIIVALGDEAMPAEPGCRYPVLTTAPCNGLWPDADGMVLVYQPAKGTDPTVLRRSSGCEAGGFDVDHVAGSIVLCEHDCATMQANPGARLYAAYPCACCL